MTTMKLRYCLFAVMVMVFHTFSVSLALQFTPAELLIVELQAQSATSASEEFIEIANITDTSIDLTNYSIQYFASTATDLTSPSRSIPMHGMLEPGKKVLVASNEYLVDIADFTFSAGISKAAGHIRLIHSQGSQQTQIDMLGWGDASTLAEMTPSQSMGNGQSLQRVVDEHGLYIDTNNNAEDFVISNEPAPESTNEEDVVEEVPNPEPQTPPEEPPPLDNPVEETLPEEPELVISPEPTEDDTEVIPPVPETEQINIQITELMPNPASPKSDSEDEFIELFNAGTSFVNLKDFRLQTGTTFSYSYTFPDRLIAPGAYMVLYSKDTPLTLSNVSSKARLLGKDNTVLFITNEYSDAEDDESWILLDGQWQWTTTATPGLSNVLTFPITPVSALLTKNATSKSTTKKATSTKSAKKPAAKKASSAVKSKSTVQPAQREVYEEPASDNQTTPLHPGALAAVAICALGYVAYEYRRDIANKIYQLRKYLQARSKTG